MGVVAIEIMKWAFVLAIGVVWPQGPGTERHEVRAGDEDSLRRALADARPGTTIRIEPGTYRGGLFARDLHGTPDRPIVLAAADPERPPVIEGGPNGVHLSGVSHIELRDLIIRGSEANGLNIDDAGRAGEPSHHVVLRGLVVRDVGPRGNRDGIKLSGLEDFRVEGCTVERWGDRGSGIDMVGCRRGEIVDSTFRHSETAGDNAVQTKGGSAQIAIRRCRFENAGQRAVNLGGSTGFDYFRPEPQGFEAKEITVEECTFVGSMAPIAFVGVDGAVVRRNTIYRPRRWVIRILQETVRDDFVPSRNGRFVENVIVFRSDEMASPLNIGPHTAPETFTMLGNVWYCLDDPSQSSPRLEIPEQGSLIGIDPGLRDPEAGDLRFREDSPIRNAGAGARGDMP